MLLEFSIIMRMIFDLLEKNSTLLYLSVFLALVVCSSKMNKCGWQWEYMKNEKREEQNHSKRSEWSGEMKSRRISVMRTYNIEYDEFECLQPEIWGRISGFPHIKLGMKYTVRGKRDE